MFLGFFNDSDNSIRGARIFNFADDKKIAVKIKTIDDTAILQKAIDDFVEWCDINCLELNTDKCKIMSFAHKKSVIKATYTIKGVPIERVDHMRDLGVIMDPKLSFHSHMEYVKKKSNSMWAFVRRECYNSFNLQIAKSLFSSLVRSHLEFASCIWAPSDLTHKNLIESTQKNAVLHLLGDLHNSGENGYILAPYVDRCDKLDFDTLTRRRVNAMVLFIKKIISGRFESPYLRDLMELNTGKRSLRNPEFIKLKYSRTDYGLNAPFNYACRAFNFASLFIDPTLPLHTFKEKLTKLPDIAFGDLTRLKSIN